MCTAISFSKKHHYFGRNLDYEHSFGEGVLITPENYKFPFEKDLGYAIIGIGITLKDYPLYFDAVNEYGLGAAGLNFPHYAFYKPNMQNKTNIPSYDFITYVLRNCKSASEAKKLLENINITDEAVDENYKPTPLHWIVSDKNESITVEPLSQGVKIYENPVGVLTNSPAFDMQMFNLNNYMFVSAGEPENKFSQKLKLDIYTRGMGAMGLPGDLSSMSRFVRASFVKLNSVCEDTEKDEVNQFFHILYSVYQQCGCARLKNNTYEITRYSSCCNADKGIYYYTTYDNFNIKSVDMHKENLKSEKPIFYPIY